MMFTLAAIALRCRLLVDVYTDDSLGIQTSADSLAGPPLQPPGLHSVEQAREGYMQATSISPEGLLPDRERSEFTAT